MLVCLKILLNLAVQNLTDRQLKYVQWFGEGY